MVMVSLLQSGTKSSAPCRVLKSPLPLQLTVRFSGSFGPDFLVENYHSPFLTPGKSPQTSTSGSIVT